MSQLVRSLLIFGVITCSVHQIAEGQTVRRALKRIFCHQCKNYDCRCTQPVTMGPAPTVCVPPATQSVGGPVAQSCTKTCTTVHPVTETRYRQENYMTYRNECRTALRQEAYCETVPTTQIENVTRDEGCYQMVWVPKPVTRQVAKTVYQQRLAYRNVPYQYTVQVPQINTRVVPEQSVRYVQQTRTYTEPMQPLTCAQPVFTAPETCAMPNPVSVSDCAVPGVHPTPVSQAPATYAPTANAPMQTPTAYAPPAQAPTAQVPSAENRTAQQAPPAYNGTSWRQIPQRSAEANAQAQSVNNYQPASAGAQQQQHAHQPTSTGAQQQQHQAHQPTSAGAQQQHHQHAQQPAPAPGHPTAATVWQTRR